MAYRYSTLADFIQASNEEVCMSRNDVAPRVLNARVWHAIASFPGCLGDNHAIARNRAHAIESASYWLLDDEPRGWRKALARDEIYYTKDGRVITLSHDMVRQLF